MMMQAVNLVVIVMMMVTVVSGSPTNLLQKTNGNSAPANPGVRGNFSGARENLANAAEAGVAHFFHGYDRSVCLHLRQHVDTRKGEFQKEMQPMRLTQQAINARAAVLSSFSEKFVGPYLQAGESLEKNISAASSPPNLPELLTLLKTTSATNPTLSVSDLQTLRSYVAKLSGDLTQELAVTVNAALDSVDNFGEGIANFFLDAECMAADLTDSLNMPDLSNQTQNPLNSGRKDTAKNLADFMSLFAHSNSVAAEINSEYGLTAGLSQLKKDLVDQAKGIMQQALKMEASGIIPALTSQNYFPADIAPHKNFSDDLNFLKVAYGLLRDAAVAELDVHPDLIQDHATKIMSLKLTASAPIEFSSVFSIQVPSGYKTAINGHVQVKPRNQSR